MAYSDLYLYLMYSSPWDVNPPAEKQRKNNCHGLAFSRFGPGHERPRTDYGSSKGPQPLFPYP